MKRSILTVVALLAISATTISSASSSMQLVYSNFSTPSPLEQIRGGAAKVQGAVVHYKASVKGSEMSDFGVLCANSERCLVEMADGSMRIFDYPAKKSYLVSSPLGDTKLVSESELLGITDFEKVECQERILSWGVDHYKFKSEGKNVEIWISSEPGFRGTISSEWNLKGIVDGLVLRVLVDGEYLIEATNLERIIYPQPRLEASLNEILF